MVIPGIASDCYVHLQECTIVGPKCEWFGDVDCAKIVSRTRPRGFPAMFGDNLLATREHLGRLLPV